MNRPEYMSDFFAARTDGYDRHMLTNVVGCHGGYIKMAELLPQDTKHILDLGCGTGLELDFIYKRFPSVSVTGIDLTKEMLCELLKKHGDKRPKIICGDYFTEELGCAYDCAVSFETLHHFRKEKKLSLYKRIYDAIRDGGCYIECDYMVDTDAEEAKYFAEADRLRAEYGIGEDEYIHFDTPCTVENQLSLLREAGFRTCELCFREGGTAIVTAKKQ